MVHFTPFLLSMLKSYVPSILSCVYSHIGTTLFFTLLFYEVAVDVLPIFWSNTCVSAAIHPIDLDNTPQFVYTVNIASRNPGRIQ